jgi:alpha,alpha-trehalase
MAYKRCLDYIEKFWKEMTFSVPESKRDRIGLPNKFVAPGPRESVFAYDQFYWDSYFIILGLLESKRIALAKGMVDNFVFMFKKFGLVPARNQFPDIDRSQPPFLTSMALEIFKKTKDKKWLKKVAKVAEDELNNYWMDKKHLAYKGLSRYCGKSKGHGPAEYESGWDLTSRFNNHCLDFLPVDLNSLLYKYEKDLAFIFGILKDRKKAGTYGKRAGKRKSIILKLMFNKKKKFFFDYNYKKKKQSNFYSLAGFYPLWAGILSDSQAVFLSKVLKKFECRGGLANTQKSGLSKKFKQWDYPNGWANQQWIVISGLLDYGFKQEALSLAKKWMNLNRKIFSETGKFWEKYDVAGLKVGREGRYHNQTGFGWTNAVFVKLSNQLNLS